MMNSHLPAGPHIPPAVPLQSHSRRHQEYRQYQQQPPPRSPGPHNPYAAYPHPQYYGIPAQMPYPMPRWHSHQHQPYPQYPMPPQAQYPPRSPLVVNSQTHGQSPHQHMPPPMRQPSYQHQPVSAASPRLAPSNPSSSMLHSVDSPVDVPLKSETPPAQLPSRRSSTVVQPTQSIRRMPFYPDLPWYSTPDAKSSFPPKALNRRRRRQNLHEANDAVALPTRPVIEEAPSGAEHETEEDPSDESTVTGLSEQETPATSQAPSENEAPISSNAGANDNMVSSKSPAPQAHGRRDTRTAVPIIPAVPHVPVARTKSVASSQAAGGSQPPPEASPTVEILPPQDSMNVNADGPTIASPPAPAIPKSWADLVRSKNAAATATSVIDAASVVNGSGNVRSGSMVEVLTRFNVEKADKIAFLEPRGLVNMGNMCYMNSILQLLVFCIPFYDFLDQVGKRAAHSFKSDTPLVDAMIMFMREFKTIDSAESAEKLRLRLKDGELEEYGAPFIPEYVYDVIRRLPRFSSMRRGHQQDAEEFLGFLLEGLHDECVTVMRAQGVPFSSSGTDAEALASPTSSVSADAGWLEVGPRQRAANTRQSGDSSTPSPVTRIFGGALRSELRVPGLKNSVTLEPYQPLQLDIGAATVNNITDALKGLTKSESLTGDFNSPRGPGTTATKQVFIESLPPVLILHLKRFQYDSSGGTQKIWKRIGYPLELEIPKDVFAPAKRGGLAIKGGLPKYRLTGVVYHHGKSAAGGHYTVDILRQDRREWIRVDDTVIRRIRPDDVAEGGAEEDPKVLAKALEAHKADEEVRKRNLFEGLDGEDENGEVNKTWSEVNGVDGKKKWAGIAANGGSATPSTAGKRTPRREGLKDSKVAYILLYEKMTE